MPRLELPQDQPVDDQTLDEILATVIVERPINPGLAFQVPEFLAQLERLVGQREPITAFRNVNGGEQPILDRINLTCWRWVGLGLLVPTLRMGTFEMTPDGAEILRERSAEARPLLSPGGLAERLRSELPGIPDATLVAIHEAQQCMLGGSYQAATVMVGVAAEGLVLTLADGIALRRSRLGLSRRRSAKAFDTIDWLQTAFAERGSAIKDAVRAAGASARWIDDLAFLLGPTNAMRIARNLVVHGGTYRATRGDVWGLLIAFPRLALVTFETTDAIRQVPPD